MKQDSLEAAQQDSLELPPLPEVAFTSVTYSVEMTPSCIRALDTPCSDMQPRCHDCLEAQLMVCATTKESND